MRAGWRQMGHALVLGAMLCCTSEEPKRDDRVPKPGAPAAVARAKLMKLNGRVDVKRAAGDDWIAAVEGMELFENDKVRTASGASAFVETLPSHATLTMEADAFIAIPDSREDITVLQGRIDAELDASDKALLIKTPSAEVKAGREIFFQ